MLDVLTNSFLAPNEPAFYDTKAKSYQELLANFHSKLNECVNEINTFTEHISKEMKEFKEDDVTSKEEHMRAIRQEFQDFINVIDLKVMGQDKDIASIYEHLTTNLATAIEEVIDTMIESGELSDAILTSLNDVKTEMESEIARVEGLITDLTSRMELAENDIEGLQIKMNSVKPDVTALKDDVETLKTDTETLKTDVETLETDVNNLETKVDDLADKIVCHRDITLTTNTSGDVSFEFDFNKYNLISGFVVTPSWSYVSVGYYTGDMASAHVFNGAGALANTEITIKIFYTLK